jgi:cell division septal protein FtsQ
MRMPALPWVEWGALVLNTNRGSGRQSRRTTLRPLSRRVRRRRRSRFETTAQAARFTVRRRASPAWDASVSFDNLVEKTKPRRKPQNRRSKARLAKERKEAQRGRFRAAVLVPGGELVRAKGRVAFSVLVLVLLGWGLVWFFASDQFYVTRIEVTGNQRVATETILAASGVHGYSIFWVNPQKVADSIARSLPPIGQVRVQYSLPNHVALQIQEQGGQVMWQVAGKRYWVDDEGYLHPAQGQDEPELLVRDIRPGLPTQVETDALVAALQIAELLPDLQVMEYAPVTGLRFTHARGWVVYLGTGSNMARRVTLLKAVQGQFSEQNARQPTLIDLRFPDSPYYRFSSEGAGGM